MADEREVSIRISASNLTGPEFDKVRAALAQVRQTSESTSASAQKLQRDYASLQAASMKLADASGQVYTDMTRVRSLTQQFGGGTALRSAEEYAAAVTRVGGASKLTANEQTQVNRVITEAVTKYKALGQEAPAHLLALQRATTQASVSAGTLTTGTIALGTALGGIAGSVVTAGLQKLSSEFSRLLDVGLQVDKIEVAYTRLTSSVGQNGDAMLVAMRRGTSGLVENVNLMQAANKAILLGLPVTTSSMGELATAATSLGRAMGQDATKSLDDLIVALGRVSPMILDNLGLSVKVGDANEVYAASLGKTVEQLTEAEKKQAFYNAAMAAARAKVKELGPAQLTFTEQMSAAWTSVSNGVVSTISTINTAMGRRIDADLNDPRTPLGALLLMKRTIDGISDGAGDVEALFQQGRTAGGLSTSPKLALPGLAPSKDQAAALLDQQVKLAEAEKKAKDAYDKLFGIDAINAAKAYASTLGSVTNVTKLTTDKQKELYAAVEKALDVYRRLGLSAPANLKQIYDALNPLVGKMHEFAGLYSASLALPGLKSGAMLAAPNFATGLTRNDALPGMNVGAQLTPDLGFVINQFKAGGWQPEPTKTSTSAGGALKFGSQLSTTIMNAVTGGGNIGQALGSGIGQQIGQNLSADLSKSLSESKTAGTFAKGLGGMFAGALPVIGALAGPLIGKVVDIFTGGAKANNLRDQLKAKFGDAAGAGLQGAIDQMKNLPGLEEAYSRFMRAGSEKDVQRAFDDLTAKMQSAQQTLDKYGMSLDDLKSPQDRFAAATQNLSGELTTLKGLGFSNTQIAKGMAGSLNDLVRSALDAGGKIPAAFQPLLEQLIKSGGLADDVASKLLGIPEKAKTPWKEMQEIAEEFGIDLEKLGINFQQAKLVEGGEELARKWRVLVDNGADLVEVNAKMAEKANDFLRNALKWGLEVPPSMRPMLEKMLETGELTDENGRKLKDLGDVKWAADPAKQFDPLIEALNRLVDYFERDLPSSLDTLRREAGKGFKIPVEQTGGGSGGGGGQDSDGDGVPDSEDAVPFNPQYWANGGISEGRQIAVLSERGEREIVGSEQFMQNALSGAMQRMGFGSSSTFGQGGTGVIHLSVVMELGGRTLDARIKDVAQTAAARGELQIPARAVTVQVPRV